MSPGLKRVAVPVRAVDPACMAVREVLSLVGDKWSVLIVALLGERTLRFSELKRSIEGISQRMLTLTLRGLERDGLVTRTVFPTVPPRVDYELTRLGRTLLGPVSALAGWANENHEALTAARQRYEAAQLKRAAPSSARRQTPTLRRAPL
jgi:DNA-binding HxlR family transcriptional regulator